jgi:hypothetical protein
MQAWAVDVKTGVLVFSPDRVADRVPVSRGEVGTWAVVVALLQWFTFLGIPLALLLAFTRLRSSAPIVRWGLVGLACAVIALQIVGLFVVETSGDVGPAHRVN